MKIRKNLTCTIYALALMAGLGLGPASLAQVDHGPIQNRLLLIFDTSSAMKKRLPAEEKALDELFAITLNGHLWPGDSIGVWTFNRDLHMGGFPLRHWTDDAITTFPPQLIAFLKSQRYTKNTRFDTLIPTLNKVVQTSPRLTTIIFCDGDGRVTDLPGANTFNGTFKQHYRQMEKARVPFVIVLRSQIGRDGTGGYVGCTISSAQSITLPQWPPLPRPPPPPPKPAPPPPAPVAPSLIIIGTNNPATNQPLPAPAPAPLQRQPPALPAPPARQNSPAAPVPAAPTPAPSVPMSETNFVPPPVATPMQPTNAAVVPPQIPAPKPPVAAAQAMPPETAGTNTHGLIAAGAGLFIVAIGILFFILRRARGRNSASLITESLKKDKIHS